MRSQRQWGRSAKVSRFRFPESEGGSADGPGPRVKVGDLMSTSVQGLVAWQQAMDLIEMVYKLTAKLPKEELYGLTSQMRRCAVSIASNIAEGQGRNSKGEFLQFLGNSRGSLEELRTQLLIAKRLKFVIDVEVDETLKQLDRVGKLLNGLMQAMRPRSFKAGTGS